MQPQPSPPQETAPEPKVSVIIVSWNSIEDLRRCLTALEASRGRDQFEVLVIDAGSRDGCGQVDADFPNVTVLRLPRNFGRTRARNIGMRTGLAELVLFLAPEVEVRPQTVLTLANALEADENVVAVVPRLVDEVGQVVPIGGKLPDPVPHGFHDLDAARYNYADTQRYNYRHLVTGAGPDGNSHSYRYHVSGAQRNHKR